MDYLPPVGREWSDLGRLWFLLHSQCPGTSSPCLRPAINILMTFWRHTVDKTRILVVKIRKGGKGRRYCNDAMWFNILMIFSSCEDALALSSHCNNHYKTQLKVCNSTGIQWDDISFLTIQNSTPRILQLSMQMLFCMIYSTKQSLKTELESSAHIWIVHICTAFFSIHIFALLHNCPLQQNFALQHKSALHW